MSRRTQLTTKYIFQVLAQLSENFIFIYLGLSLITEKDLLYKPVLIIVTVIAVCAARWVAVFPLSMAINWFGHYRARRRGIRDSVDELPYNYQAMLFWAGLRGAVGVALAALLRGKDTYALKATVLVVVVLTVIIFGGTTANMLEILGIRTGVVEEIDSDDEFDIEAVSGGSYFKRSGTGIGYHPRRSSTLALNAVDGNGNGRRGGDARRDGNGWTSGHRSPNTLTRPGSLSRATSDLERSDLLGHPASATDSEIGSDIDTSDLPPPAPRRRSSPLPPGSAEETGPNEASSAPRGAAEGGSTMGGISATAASATAAIRHLLNTEDPSALFRQLDEDFIKPTLLLDGGHAHGRGNGDAGPS